MIKRLLIPTAGPKPARDKAQYIMEMAHSLGVEEVDVIHILDLGEFDDGRDALNIFVEMAYIHYFFYPALYFVFARSLNLWT